MLSGLQSTAELLDIEFRGSQSKFLYDLLFFPALKLTLSRFHTQWGKTEKHSFEEYNMALNPFFTPLLRTSPGDTAVYPDMSRELMPCKPSAGQKRSKRQHKKRPQMCLIKLVILADSACLARQIYVLHETFQSNTRGIFNICNVDHYC